jgi:hypothetical protein
MVKLYAGDRQTDIAEVIFVPYFSIDNAHLMYNAHPNFSTFLLMYR